MEGMKEVKIDTYEVYEGRTSTKAGRKEGRSGERKLMKEERRR